MGFWGTLGKIGGSLIGLGGGPSADKIADSVLSKIGGVTSGAAAGSANQRLQEGQLGLQSAQFNRQGQDRAQKNAILMQLLSNLQDAQITPGNPAIASAMGRSVGGLRPSALTNNKDALMSVLSQPQIMAPEYQAGGMEKTLGGVGLASSILGALSGFRKAQG